MGPAKCQRLFPPRSPKGLETGAAQRRVAPGHRDAFVFPPGVGARAVTGGCETVGLRAIAAPRRPIPPQLTSPHPALLGRKARSTRCCRSCCRAVRPGSAVSAPHAEHSAIAASNRRRAPHRLHLAAAGVRPSFPAASPCSVSGRPQRVSHSVLVHRGLHLDHSPGCSGAFTRLSAMCLCTRPMNSSLGSVANRWISSNSTPARGSPPLRLDHLRLPLGDQLIPDCFRSTFRQDQP